jgi:hypothetical protein
MSKWEIYIIVILGLGMLGIITLVVCSEIILVRKELNSLWHLIDGRLGEISEKMDLIEMNTKPIFEDFGSISPTLFDIRKDVREFLKKLPDNNYEIENNIENIQGVLKDIAISVESINKMINYRVGYWRQDDDDDVM